MRQYALSWSEKIEEHIAHHHVSRGEVEDVVASTSSRAFRGKGKNVYAILGQTVSGRYLKIIIKVESPERAFVITALEMNIADRALFRRKKKG